MSPMKSKVLDALEISTDSSPDASIIWLHGLGADGHDFAPVVKELRLPIPIRFILPHAPLLAVTINGGHQMPAWYDIASGEITALQDEAGIRNSQAEIERIILQEISRGIASHRILLAGFSQGGAVVLQTGLRYRDRLGGIIALSTYLPLVSTLDTESSPSNASTPIFMAHGNQDRMIPIEKAYASRDLLTSRGYPLAWHEYAMAHGVCDKEITDIRNFILTTLTS